MNTHYPPHQPPGEPRRLERSKDNQILGGVCAGVANYLNLDPTVVRVLTVLITLFTGVPVVLYVVALFVMPEAGSRPPAEQPPAPAPSPSPSPGFPPAPPAPPAPDTGGEADVWGTEGAPWENSRSGADGPTIDPVYPEPTSPVTPSDPDPVTPSDPEPVGPSDPEAPVVTPQEESDPRPGPGSDTA